MIYNYCAKVVRILDADTIEFDYDLGFDIHLIKETRISNYDAPETWRPRNESEEEHGKLATDFCKNLLPVGEVFDLEVLNKGKFGRPLVNVFLHNGRNYVDVMKKEGFSKKLKYIKE